MAFISSIVWRCWLIALACTSHTSTVFASRCSCQDLTMDCAGLKKDKLEEDDFCSGDVMTTNLQRNLFETVPEGLKDSVTFLDMNSNRLQAIPRPPLLPPKLEHLNLAINQIDSETTDELSTMSSLTVLNLTDNFVSTLNFLPNVCNLEILDITLNKIEQLDGSLLRCNNLVELHASTNFIMIESRTFTPFKKLRYLGLGENSIQELPPTIFDVLVDLKTLKLESNEISSLPEGIFDSLTELQYLSLDHNIISSLSPTIFSKLTKLRVLKLEFNKLSFLPDFTVHENLEELHISSNYIARIPDKAFANLKKLQVLNLMSNYIESFPHDTFLGLENLKEVYISYNPVNDLPENILSNLNNLKILSMMGLKLKSKFLESLRHLPNLEIVDLSKNDIDSIPTNAFQSMHQLVKLILMQNPLRVVTSAYFKDLPLLKTLDLSGTELTALPEDVFSQLHSLEELILSFNPFSTLEEGLFKSNTNLKSLVLTSSQLEYLPDGIFAGLINLQRVFLGHNKLNNVPIFDNHPQLIDVFLHDNAIVEPKEDAIRLLLTNKPHCTSQLYMNLVRPESLKWLLTNEYSLTTDRRMMNCGMVNNNGTRVGICVDAQCGPDKPFKNWIEAVQAS